MWYSILCVLWLRVQPAVEQRQAAQYGGSVDAQATHTTTDSTPPPSFPFLLQWRSESSYCREIQNVLLCTVPFIIETLTVFLFLLQNKRGVGFRSKGEWLQSHWMMGCRYPSVDELISSRFALGVNSWISGLDGDNPSGRCIRKWRHWLRAISI